jgi:gas vesicle protein
LDNVVEELAIAGDGSWVVIYGNYYVSSEGVAEQLTNKLSKFFSDQCRRVNNRNREIREARQEAREAAKLAKAERVAREIKEREERELIQQEEREKEHARGR